MKLLLPRWVSSGKETAHPDRPGGTCTKINSYIPLGFGLGVEQFWQGDFLFLMRNFSWMLYAGAHRGRKLQRGRRVVLNIVYIIIITWGETLSSFIPSRF